MKIITTTDMYGTVKYSLQQEYGSTTRYPVWRASSLEQLRMVATCALSGQELQSAFDAIDRFKELRCGHRNSAACERIGNDKRGFACRRKLGGAVVDEFA